MDNVSKVVNQGLCTSCGLCACICNKDAIFFDYGKERNIPVVDSSKCIDCGLCYKICPGQGVEIEKISNILFGSSSEQVKKEKYVGHFISTFVGHSTNYNIRYHSATGGMVTQFLISLLRNKDIDGAVVVGWNQNDVFDPKPILATTEEQILNSKSSKYVVVSFDKVAKSIIQSDLQKVVVVGLPCHIQGFRKLSQVNKKFASKIIGYFAIYCSVNKTKHSIDYYNYRYNISPKKVGCFSFRDDGCMGCMKFSDKEGNTIKKVPYQSYWFGTHSFFTNHRCSLCIDQFGELADISFGDIHIDPYKNDTLGTNSIITRSSFWHNKLIEIQMRREISLKQIPVEALISSQQYVIQFKKGAGQKANTQLRWLLGKKNPIYDSIITTKPSLKNYLSEIIKMIMRAIGHHKSLWFIIKALDRNSD